MALEERAARAGCDLPTADEVTAWFARARPATIVEGGAVAHRALLAEVCREPDLAPLLAGVAVAVDRGGDALFEITGPRT
ncbi:MAG: hypothetical protein M3N16_05265, partial [Actinomycetota bacterium]|nr:hypothetical protein [Actinomycetota bacterium]